MKEDEFKGMSDRESVDHQIKTWAKGVPLHNTVRDECCPDFSCCNGGHMMALDARKALEAAHIRGDNETVLNICMGGLSALTSNLDVSVHIVGGDVTEH